MVASARANSASRNFTSAPISCVGPKHVFGRHLPRLELGQDQFPAVAVARQRLDRAVERDVEPAGGVVGMVALAAGLFEERLGRRGKRGLAGRSVRLDEPPVAPVRGFAAAAAAGADVLPAGGAVCPDGCAGRLPRQLDADREHQGARRHANRAGVKSHSCAPRPRPGLGAGAAETMVV